MPLAPRGGLEPPTSRLHKPICFQMAWTISSPPFLKKGEGLGASAKRRRCNHLVSAPATNYRAFMDWLRITIWLDKLAI